MSDLNFPLCIDCKHYRLAAVSSPYDQYTGHINKVKHQCLRLKSLVDGGEIVLNAEGERASTESRGSCNMSGIFFEKSSPTTPTEAA